MMADKEVKPGSERDVQRRAIIWLRKSGWLVINSSGSWRATRGMRGVPDLICHYKGLVVYVEAKGFTNQALRPTQQKFYSRLVPHLSETLGFSIVNDDNFERWQAHMSDLKDWRDRDDNTV